MCSAVPTPTPTACSQPGSTVVDLALNPVSINAVGQLAIRVTLADGRQFVLRADPAGP